MTEPRTRDEDANTIAARIVAEVTGEEPDEDTAEIVAEAIRQGKNPAAVLLGRRGGLKGGKARAEKLTKEQRSEIARKAARKRWQYDQ